MTQLQRSDNDAEASLRFKNCKQELTSSLSLPSPFSPSQPQSLLGTHNLGRVHYEPIKDRHGNVLLVTIRDLESQHSLFNGKWMQVTKLQSQRKSLSTPEEPYALDILIITIQVRKESALTRCALSNFFCPLYCQGGQFLVQDTVLLECRKSKYPSSAPQSERSRENLDPPD